MCVDMGRAKGWVELCFDVSVNMLGVRNMVESGMIRDNNCSIVCSILE